MPKDFPNMSYCQFNNTLAGVKQCYDTLANDGDTPKEAYENLSQREKEAHDELMLTMSNLLCDLGYTVLAPGEDDD